ncbi:LacI family DNA-binding transcriptional regulator [Microbacterium sp. C5A9]|uniref:LacI family DNA-binding transcriptional regulator n=1 Tax=Microbacterium sp. C5A9 TaxID=2736663 RepID=UPI001F5159F5|nr:LacI family DNA-binding transcriptional regulator [Microbacterium sp. C5A9]MCI1017115.1 LacI family DNA-binding transcriptional regulator [Microbacterium sp. C5A9]
MARASSRPGITDVAKLAGVSLSTVSRAMNGNPTVDPALAERVQAAAVQLGYTANPVARSLVLGRTQTVAVVIPDLENPTFQAVLRGLSRAATADGFHVLVADSREDLDAEQALARATRLRTDGVILCAPRMPEAELGELLSALSPAVVINRGAQDGAPVVGADYESGMREIVDHLTALGHRRLVYLAGATRSVTHRARQRAIAEAVARTADLDVREIAAGVDFDSGTAVADQVLATGATGVIAYNDLVAMGLLSALTARGVAVPEAISITGFDDIPFAAYTSPPLSTAAVPAVELGERAWAAMHAQLTGGEATPMLTLTPTLVVRGSSAPPRTV